MEVISSISIKKRINTFRSLETFNALIPKNKTSAFSNVHKTYPIPSGKKENGDMRIANVGLYLNKSK